VPVTLKSLRPKDYSEDPQTLGQHLKKRRKERGLFQREVAAEMGVDTWTYLNWEKDKTVPVAARFRPVVEFRGYDPTPPARTLAERLQAKRRELGVTFSQVARDLCSDEGSLTRYLNVANAAAADCRARRLSRKIYIGVRCTLVDAAHGPMELPPPSRRGS
jgi:transcriptional regulator with XRE-family HTH domain